MREQTTADRLAFSVTTVAQRAILGLIHTEATTATASIIVIAIIIIIAFDLLARDERIQVSKLERLTAHLLKVSIRIAYLDIEIACVPLEALTRRIVILELVVHVRAASVNRFVYVHDYVQDFDAVYVVVNVQVGLFLVDYAFELDKIQDARVLVIYFGMEDARVLFECLYELLFLIVVQTAIQNVHQLGAFNSFSNVRMKKDVIFIYHAKGDFRLGAKGIIQTRVNFFLENFKPDDFDFLEILFK